MEEYYELLAETIDLNDQETLLMVLNEVDLTAVKLIDIKALYYYLLSLCYTNKNGDLIRVVSNFFKAGLNEKIEAYVLSYRPFDPNVFNFYFTHNRRDFQFYAVSIFSFDDEDVIHGVWSTLTHTESVAKADLTRESCIHLLDKLFILSEQETPFGETLELLLRQLLSEYAPAITKPEHVLTYNHVPYNKELKEKKQEIVAKAAVQLYESETKAGRIKEIVAFMAQESYHAGQIRCHEIPRFMINLHEEIQTHTYEEFNQFFRNYEEKVIAAKLQDNDELTRISGPCHPKMGVYKLDNDPNAHICLQFGGCRMMTCVEFEYDEDEPDAGLYWFTGVCDRSDCAKEIPFKHWAFRIALDAGGFKGCYCSKEHAIQDCKDAGYQMTSQTTEKLCNELLEVGIYDRRRKEIDVIATRKRQRELGAQFLNYLQEHREVIVMEPVKTKPERSELLIINPTF